MSACLPVAARSAPNIMGHNPTKPTLRQSARCTVCGNKGATLQYPRWVDPQFGFSRSRPTRYNGTPWPKIYGLYSARDGRVRYVGQTGGTRDARFRKHVRVYVGQWTTLVYEWVHSEWKRGYPVESALLEWCEYEKRRDVEKVWISKFPDLLNERVYNFRGGTPPVIPEIKEYRRRFLFNVNGYRGIHWCRQLDRYCVLVYTGNGIDWLDGDGAPNSESDIWFSDRIQALRQGTDGGDGRGAKTGCPIMSNQTANGQNCHFLDGKTTENGSELKLKKCRLRV